MWWLQSHSFVAHKFVIHIIYIYTYIFYWYIYILYIYYIFLIYIKYYIILYYMILYCIILFYIILYYIILYHIIIIHSSIYIYISHGLSWAPKSSMMFHSIPSWAPSPLHLFDWIDSISPSGPSPCSCYRSRWFQWCQMQKHSVTVPPGKKPGFWSVSVVPILMFNQTRVELAELSSSGYLAIPYPLVI